LLNDGREIVFGTDAHWEFGRHDIPRGGGFEFRIQNIGGGHKNHTGFVESLSNRYAFGEFSHAQRARKIEVCD
jgi:hypothetical protein